MLRQDPNITFQDVHRVELDNRPDLSTQPGVLMSDINRYADRHNFNGGIPDFEEGDHGQGALYGSLFFSGNLSTFKDVSMSDLTIVAGPPPEAPL